MLTYLLYRCNTLSGIQTNVNNELKKVFEWLCANKLSINIQKSNFVIFHSRQHKVDTNLQIFINEEELKREWSIKHLGIMLDSNLNWKSHINYTVKKVKRSIGLLSKLRYYINSFTLKKLYYALIYPFLTYGILVWGSTYCTTLQPLFILQKKVVRIITFSKFYEHTSPIFKRLKLIKLNDLLYLYTAVFMYKFHRKLLPSTFDNFFSTVAAKHNYGTRLSTKQSLSLPKVNTNYGIFNIRFQGPKIWNSIPRMDKSLSLNKFKQRINQKTIESY